jgi:2,3-bisphosphoglycerate-dependent phosphoglycerate mutase
MIFLVRHADARWMPDPARPLSPRGEEDAVLVADLLEEQPIEAVYCSSEYRAVQTVLPLAQRKGLQITEDDRLCERHLTDYKLDDFKAMVRAAWDDPDFCLPGGETNRAAQKRGVEAIEEIVERHPRGNVVAGTHGTLLALIVRQYLPQTGFDLWNDMTFPDVYGFHILGSGGAELRRLWRPTSRTGVRQ